MCIFLLQINWFITSNVVARHSQKDEMQLTSALQKNCQSIHYLLCGKCMQIAYVAMHTQTLTRDIERKEKIERETTKKYRVQDWKRVFNNKLNMKTWSFFVPSLVSHSRNALSMWCSVLSTRSITNCTRSNADWMQWKKQREEKTDAKNILISKNLCSSCGRVRAEKEKRWKKSIRFIHKYEQ